MFSPASLLDVAARKVTQRVIRHAPGPRFSIKAERPIVTFTFDDIPDSALTEGAAVLEANGAKGTFYIAGGLAGAHEPDRDLITVEQIAELSARGHEIGCHTFSHPWVRHLSPAELRRDLDRNKAFHAHHAPASQIKNFAFPYNASKIGIRGDMMDRFRTCRGGVEAVNRGPTDLAFLRSVEIRPPDAYARTLTRWIDDAVRTPGWLIYFTHDVQARPTPFGCTPDTLDFLVRYALDHGCEVLTVDAALDRLGVPQRNS